jgi:hypothetical protein
MQYACQPLHIRIAPRYMRNIFHKNTCTVRIVYGDDKKIEYLGSMTCREMDIF